MIRLKPLRCIRTNIDPFIGEREYYYAPQGSAKHIYHIKKACRNWICFVDDGHSNSEPYSIHFENVLKQMHIHYRTVYRKKIEDIVA